MQIRQQNLQFLNFAPSNFPCCNIQMEKERQGRGDRERGESNSAGIQRDWEENSGIKREKDREWRWWWRWKFRDWKGKWDKRNFSGENGGILAVQVRRRWKPKVRVAEFAGWIWLLYSVSIRTQTEAQFLNLKTEWKLGFYIRNRCNGFYSWTQNALLGLDQF